MGEVESEGQRLANEWADECLTADAALAIDAALRRAKGEGVREASKMADEYGAKEWSNTCVQDGMARLSLRLDARAAQIEEGEDLK